MSWNNYTRIQVLLPVNSLPELDAATSAEIDIRNAFGGATATSRDPAIFHGFWWSSADVWIEDKLVLVIADSEAGRYDIDRLIEGLHDRLGRYYEAAASVQEAFWITQSPIEVFSP